MEICDHEQYHCDMFVFMYKGRIGVAVIVCEPLRIELVSSCYRKKWEDC